MPSLLEQGDQLAQQGKLPEAIQAWERHLEMTPHVTAPCYNLALAYYQLQNLPKALTALQKLLNQEPHHAEALYLSGLIFLEQQAFQSAADVFKQTLNSQAHHRGGRNNPQLILGALNNLGLIACLQKEFATAIPYFEKAIATDAQYPDAYYNLGTTYYELGEFKKAIDCFAKALQFQTGEPVKAYNNMGLCYFHLQQYPAAEQAYRAALDLDAHYAVTYFNLGLLHYQTGQFDTALHEYQQAQQQGFSPSLLDYHLGLTWLALNQTAKAHAHWRKVLQAERPQNYLVQDIRNHPEGQAL